MTLDRALETENMLLRASPMTACIIIVSSEYSSSSDEPTDDSTYCSYMYSESESIARKKKGKLFLASAIHRTVAGHDEYSSSGWYLVGQSEDRG